MKDLVSSIDLFLYPGGEWSLRRDSAIQRFVQHELNFYQPLGLTSSALVLWDFRQLHFDTKVQVPGFGAEAHPRNSVNLSLSESEEQLWMVPVPVSLLFRDIWTSCLAGTAPQFGSVQTPDTLEQSKSKLTTFQQGSGILLPFLEQFQFPATIQW